MVSALTVLLGCWLAGRSGALGQGSYPKPSISVSPGGVIPVGGNFTIQCWHQRLGVRFVLYKDGDGNHLTYTDSASYGAEFPIPSARREHGGSYTCRSYRTGPTGYSEPSDPVQIIVVGRCQERSSAGRDSAGVNFPIPEVSRADGGSYTCYYPPDSDPDTWSEPSDPVESVVTGPAGPLAQQRGHPPGRRDRVTGVFPSHRGEAAAGDLGLRKGGPLPPGGAAEQGGPFPGNTS
ncbi:unnamed protein product, partial [Lepidochelys kempii]